MNPPNAAQTDDDLYEQLQAFVGMEVGDPMPAPDAVNIPMIHHWCEAIGDTNPRYGGDDPIAPPTMLQAWVMHGMKGPERNDDSPYEQMNALLFAQGFTSVVATNCEQTYERDLRPGDRLSMRTVIDAISPQKTTGLGTGHFITTRQDYYDQANELVGSMLFRIIRFRPAAKAKAPDTEAKPPRPTPATTPDNTWWFDELNAGQLRIQRCANCQELRHPTGPMCPTCHSLEFDSIAASGDGTIHSHVTVHHPQVPGFDYPLPVVLVDLAEGVRMLMNAEGEGPIQIGEPVKIEVREVDPGVRLPFAIRQTAQETGASA